MILFTLRCTRGHEFEGWFRDGDGFETQRKAGEIACPECSDTSVEKAVMAPRLGRSREINAADVSRPVSRSVGRDAPADRDQL